MKHPFTLALFGIVLVLCVMLGLVVALQWHVDSIPDDWTTPTDDGSGDIDNADGAADDVIITPIVSESGNVEVSSPAAGEMIGMPLAVHGRARVFESTLNYRLRDADGTILTEGNVMTNAPDAGEFGDFVVTTSYDTPSGTAGVLEVFDYSAKDGSVIDLVQVPVLFPTVETMTVNVFWTTPESGADCSLVASTIHRVPKTVATAYTAISELLAGPDSTDASLGFTTSIPEFTALKSITVEDGVAKVEFTSAIESGGSCRVTSIRSQIESTLLQFPTITKVIITSEGKTPEETLQP